jgi:hypothetical protein
MSWLGTIILGVVLLAAGLYVSLAVAIIVTALLERRPVKFLTPAESDDPEWQKLAVIGSDRRPRDDPESDTNPYEAAGTAPFPEPQICAANRLGFSAPGLFRHAMGGIYKTYGALLVSPSREILAVFRWGTTAGIRNRGTVLYTELENGRYLVTSDRPTGSRTPGLYDEILYMDADFEQLVDRHEARIRASGQHTKPFSAENALAAFEAIHEARASFLVANGEAYWLDAEHTEFRSTIKGALKAYAQTLSTKHVDRSLVRPRSLRAG